jgi:arylsulfatase A-like enzyme
MLNRLLVILLAVVAPNSVSRAHAAPPNIVMIISDDHLWTDYSFMGHPTIKTPHLDKLAAQSLTFTRGYVPSSLCCPSLASIITGLYPHQHKVTSNDPPVPTSPATPAPKTEAKKGVAKKGAAKGANRQDSPEFLAGREVMNKHMEAVPTLARELVKNGYLALQTGKWWQGHFSRGGFTHGMTKGSRHGDEGLDIGRKTMQPIYDFIGEAKQANKPFFVWYAPLMPHDPHTPPERLLNKYQAKTPSLHVAKYMAMVEWFDETIGDLMKNLEAQGMADNTIVVYVTDNGWITNPDTGRYAPKSKQSQYDGGLRTPIMVRWPAKVKPQMSDSLAMSIDLMPTLLNAVGLKPTKEMQGINLLDAKAVKSRTTIQGECFTHNSMDLHNPVASLRWRWMIEGDWKLIVPDAKNEPKEVVELYNLATDKFEEKNLAATDPARVAALQKKLDAWWPAK